MQQWEYTVLSVYEEKGKWVFEHQGRKYPESERTRVMSELGLNGWELVCALPFDTTASPGAWAVTYTNNYMLFFKHPIG
jgi:hypothetical protein